MSSNQYSISIIGAIEILVKELNLSPKSVIRAEYKEKPEFGESARWWEFQVLGEDSEIHIYELSMHTEEVYLVEAELDFFTTCTVEECLQDTGLF